jgi:hypothetical protein
MCFADVAANLIQKEQEKEDFVSNLDVDSTKASRRWTSSRLALGKLPSESMDLVHHRLPALPQPPPHPRTLSHTHCATLSLPRCRLEEREGGAGVAATSCRAAPTPATAAPGHLLPQLLATFCRSSCPRMGVVQSAVVPRRCAASLPGGSGGKEGRC